MDKKVGITWNGSGVYLWGLEEYEIEAILEPSIKKRFPRLRLSETSSNFFVKRISKLSGQDASIGKEIIAILLDSGWKPCDDPTSDGDYSGMLPVWGWGEWFQKEQI